MSWYQFDLIYIDFHIAQEGVDNKMKIIAPLIIYSSIEQPM